MNTETRTDAEVRAADAAAMAEGDAIEQRAISSRRNIVNRRADDAKLPRAQTRGRYRDLDGRPRIVGTGQPIPEGWTRIESAVLEDRTASVQAEDPTERNQGSDHIPTAAGQTDEVVLDNDVAELTAVAELLAIDDLPDSPTAAQLQNAIAQAGPQTIVDALVNAANDRDELDNVREQLAAKRQELSEAKAQLRTAKAAKPKPDPKTAPAGADGA